MIRLDASDTIAAISSPPGPALRGIVRLSGPDAWRIASGRFEIDATCPLPSRAEVRRGRLEILGIRPKLPADIAFWPGTRTFTGQPLAEILTVGSGPVLDLVLADRVKLGARIAEPGEFTLRAFLNGKIDLTRAEAVLGVIEARSPAQLDSALRQLAGGIARPIERLRDRLLDVLAHLEAGLDFVDEPDVDPIGRSALADELATGSRTLSRLAEQMTARDRPEARPRVVLVGPPNAGKSRLFNALAGREQALVSPVAGTTRDYLSAAGDCDGIEVEFIDTAGIEAPRSAIEANAQQHRDGQEIRADLIIECRPASDDLPWSYLPDRTGRRLLIATMIDLARPPRGILGTSAVTGEGIVPLRHEIATRLIGGNPEGMGTSARCRESLSNASTALHSAAMTLADQGGDELVAIDLRQCLEDLGRVVGETVSDDILDRIFRRFCIGK